MIILAFVAFMIQIIHRVDRMNLTLQHEPGTIASAVSIGAQTGAGELLAGRQRARDIDDVLRGKKFRIDPDTMRIVMEGEEGYDFGGSPTERRQSIFAALQSNPSKRASRRLSLASQAPRSPLAPRSPAAMGAISEEKD